MVRPGYEAEGCWNCGPAKEVGFSLGVGETSPSNSLTVQKPGSEQSDSTSLASFDRPSFIFPETPMVRRGVKEMAEEMCEQLGSQKQGLIKASGTDKLSQEDPPSQKAGLTRHTHMQDSLWNSEREEWRL